MRTVDDGATRAHVGRQRRRRVVYRGGVASGTMINSAGVTASSGGSRAARPSTTAISTRPGQATGTVRSGGMVDAVGRRGERHDRQQRRPAERQCGAAASGTVSGAPGTSVYRRHVHRGRSSAAVGVTRRVERRRGERQLSKAAASRTYGLGPATATVLSGGAGRCVLRRRRERHRAQRRQRRMVGSPPRSSGTAVDSGGQRGRRQRGALITAASEHHAASAVTREWGLADLRLGQRHPGVGCWWFRTSRRRPRDRHGAGRWLRVMSATPAVASGICSRASTPSR